MMQSMKQINELFDFIINNIRANQTTSWGKNVLIAHLKELQIKALTEFGKEFKL